MLESVRVGEQGVHALAHFAGGLVGEGDGQDGRWRHTRCADEVGDAVRDHAGLAAARAGQDQERTFGMANGFTLLGIQPVEKIHEWGHLDCNTRVAEPVRAALVLLDGELERRARPGWHQKRR